MTRALTNRLTCRLTYRLVEERDIPALLRLWEEAGWGTLTEDVWRQWFVETPHGCCVVAVAVDNRGEVVAQEMFTPSLVSIDGREVRALRFSAPIVSRSIRGVSLRHPEHPVFGLYRTAAEAAAAQGFGIIYSLPEHAWLPIFRLVSGFAEAAYPCVEVPLDAHGGDNLFVGRPAEFTDEYDRLWLSARETFPIHCGVVRRHEWVRFRNSGRTAVEVRDASDGSLAGYASVKKQTGLLADVLARRPDELPHVLRTTLRWLSEHGGGLTHLKVMQTPALAAALEGLPSETVDYRFAFTCRALDETLPAEAIAPERWHAMPGD
ncbi:MAG TPA: hypothetical protein VEK57_02820 [Thermoanaerobaculia bacterium]|nr:hypothetical protein [Thermoanaerobaculia bacterium]